MPRYPTGEIGDENSTLAPAWNLAEDPDFGFMSEFTMFGEFNPNADIPASRFEAPRTRTYTNINSPWDADA